MVLKEVCTETLADIEKAIAAGANRFELCARLDVGGTTPSVDVILEAVRICRGHDVPVMVIIRPRGGDFVYSASELQQMREEIDIVRKCGAHGVVFGALTPDGDIDMDAVRDLVRASDGMSRTFHMAFDHIVPSRQLEAIDTLSMLGFDRILSHGVINSAQPDLQRLKQYVERSNGRIAIMPGGGVTQADNTLLKVDTMRCFSRVVWIPVLGLQLRSYTDAGNSQRSSFNRRQRGDTLQSPPSLNEPQLVAKLLELFPVDKTYIPISKWAAQMPDELKEGLVCYGGLCSFVRSQSNFFIVRKENDINIVSLSRAGSDLSSEKRRNDAKLEKLNRTRSFGGGDGGARRFSPRA